MGCQAQPEYPVEGRNICPQFPLSWLQLQELRFRPLCKAWLPSEHQNVRNHSMHDLTCLEYLVDPLFVDASCSATAGIVELPLELHAVLIVLPQVALAHQQLLLADPSFHLEDIVLDP